MVLSLLLASLTAAHAAVPISLTAGANGVIDTAGGGWLGQYVYVGPSALIPITDTLAFIPSLAIEVAPEAGNWGFLFTPAIELAVRPHIGIDFVPSVIQDTKGGTTSVVLAAGPGATYLFDGGATFSIAAQAAYVVGANAPITINPILQIGIPFP